MRFIHARVGAVALLGFFCTAMSTVDSAEPQIVIDVPESAVTGLPLPIELQVTGPLSVPITGPFRDVNPVAIELTGADGRIVFPIATTPTVVWWRPFFDEFGRDWDYIRARFSEINGNMIEVPAIGTTSFLVDLSQVEGLSDSKRFRLAVNPDVGNVKADDYGIRSSHSKVNTVLETKRLSLVAPNPAEERLLQAVRRFYKEEFIYVVKKGAPEPDSIWRAFTIAYPDVMSGVSWDDLSETGRKQLYYFYVLAKLARIEALADGNEVGFAIDLNRSLPAFHTDLLIMQYELQIIQNRTQEAKQTLNQVVAKRPDLKNSLLLYADNDWGPIRSLRSDIDRLKP